MNHPFIVLRTCRIVSERQSGYWVTVRDGSTATTNRDAGSYEPVPAPTLRIELQPATAALDCRADPRIAAPAGVSGNYAAFFPLV